MFVIYKANTIRAHIMPSILIKFSDFDAYWQSYRCHLHHKKGWRQEKATESKNEKRIIYFRFEDFWFLFENDSIVFVMWRKVNIRMRLAFNRLIVLLTHWFDSIWLWIAGHCLNKLISRWYDRLAIFPSGVRVNQKPQLIQ